MCGHFGIAGFGINQHDLEIFRQLGIVSQLRGEDGAGIYQINSGSATRWDNQKLVKSAGDFMYTYYLGTDGQKKHTDKVCQTTMIDVLIGHCRAATKGSIIDSNAQPFEFSNLVGAHNGTLKDKKYDDKIRSDSDLFFEDVNSKSQDGCLSGLESCLKDLNENSAYAIVMYDKLKKQLIFVKNSKRPLFFAVSRERDVMYWASERAFLALILNRNGIKYQHYDEVNQKIIGGIFQVPDNRLLICKPREIKACKPPFKAGNFIVDPEDKPKEVQEVQKETSKGTKLLIKSNDNVTVLPSPTKGVGIKRCQTCNTELDLSTQWDIRYGRIDGYYDSENDKFYCKCIVPEKYRLKCDEIKDIRSVQ